ncbi:MAG TPA: hypothetical protein PK513_03075 [Alphaproteobacteria bacterium]|nr:hypothetical protein [Alphaproteobacteria bacterium]USO06264.1 MAG: hypothetical protein H6859_03470 [Rhodospirillales bacterium]HOO81468.1 hypothetical protein [Alphaproteobacteria bacterium]
MRRDGLSEENSNNITIFQRIAETLRKTEQDRINLVTNAPQYIKGEVTLIDNQKAPMGGSPALKINGDSLVLHEFRGRQWIEERQGRGDSSISQILTQMESHVEPQNP